MRLLGILSYLGRVALGLLLAAWLFSNIDL
jgi:hypothetical protein